MKKSFYFMMATSLLFSHFLYSQSQTTQLHLKLDMGEYAAHGKWSVYVNSLVDGKYTQDKYDLVPNEKGECVVKISRGEFSIATLFFLYHHKEEPWQGQLPIYLGDKKNIDLSEIKATDRSLYLAQDKIKNQNIKGLLYIREHLNDISRKFFNKGITTQEVNELLKECFQLADHFHSNASIDEPLKKYLRYICYNSYYNSLSSLARQRITYTFEPEISIDPFDIYNSKYFPFEYSSLMNLSNLIDQEVKKSFPERRLYTEGKIKVTKGKISNPYTQQALIEYYLNAYIRGYKVGENFNTDIENFSTMTQYLNDGEKRNEMIQTFKNLQSSQVGASIPDITVVNHEGEALKLSSLFDGQHYVYIDLWASWCKPCVGEIPALKILEKDFDGTAIKFVSISIDRKAEAWHEALKDHDLHGHQLLDQEGNISKYLNVSGIPRFLLYSPQGKMISYDAPRPSDSRVRDLFNKYIQ